MTLDPEEGYTDIGKTKDKFKKKKCIVETAEEIRSSCNNENGIVGWPRKGDIKFTNVGVKYRPELPNVLSDLC